VLSCTTLLRQAAPNPMNLPGYWKHDAGHAGVYTTSVADIVALTEEMLQIPEAHDRTSAHVPSSDQTCATPRSPLGRLRMAA
jgi:hypothetical protein